MTTGDPSNERLTVTPPKQWATGFPAVTHALQYSLEQTSPRRTALTLLTINQANGIDCPGCAWPEPEPNKRHINEYCENGAKHINDDATTRRITREFFAEHPISELVSKSDMWLNQQGRLTEPMVKQPGSDYYEPIGWDDAFELLAAQLRGLDSSDEALFYTSGRTWDDGVERRAKGFRLVAYKAARGSAASYYPETNVLVPLDSVAEISNTPASKGIFVRLEPAAH